MGPAKANNNNNNTVFALCHSYDKNKTLKKRLPFVARLSSYKNGFSTSLFLKAAMFAGVSKET